LLTAAGMKRILVADDDLGMLHLIGRALPDYRITVARDGFEALAISAQRGDWDLLITDYMMPTMTGDSLAGRLRAAHPEMKTLLVTSHAEFVDASTCGTDAKLSKPFQVAALRQAVTSLIGAA
jgi:CheY-like chemotaxis protein